MATKVSRNWIWIGIAVAAVVTAGLILASLKPAGPPKAATAGAPKEETVIRIPDTFAEIAYVGEEKGFFKDEGIKLEYTGKQAYGPGNIQSVIAGLNDAGDSVLTPTILARAKGEKIKIVMAEGPSGEREPVITWLVLKDGPIKRIEDLLGKKVVGIPGTITWYPITEYLRKKGLDYNKIEFVTLPAPQQEQALRQGQVAAISSSEPFTSEILKKGGVRVLTTDYDILGIEHIGGWSFSEKFINERPEAVRGFISAYSRTAKWISASDANLQEALAIAKERGGWYFQRTWNDQDTKLLLTEEDVQSWIDILVANKYLKKDQVKASDIYTNEFNPNDAK